MCPQGNSGPPAVTFTEWLKWCVHARCMNVLSVIVSERNGKEARERREKWGAIDRLVVSFWNCFTMTLGGLMLLYYMEGGGLVVLPWRNFGRICAELWYSEPTWTKNSAYWAVPFLDFWVLELYWNYNWLFWKLMKREEDWMLNSWLHTFWMFWTQKFFKIN